MQTRLDEIKMYLELYRPELTKLESSIQSLGKATGDLERKKAADKKEHEQDQAKHRAHGDTHEKHMQERRHSSPPKREEDVHDVDHDDHDEGFDKNITENLTTYHKNLTRLLDEKATLVKLIKTLEDEQRELLQKMTASQTITNQPSAPTCPKTHTSIAPGGPSAACDDHDDEDDHDNKSESKAISSPTQGNAVATSQPQPSAPPLGSPPQQRRSTISSSSSGRVSYLGFQGAYSKPQPSNNTSVFTNLFKAFGFKN